MDYNELVYRYNNGERFKFFFFFKSNDKFSNWYPADFIINDVQYWCVEQYMMAKKAELFKDYNIQKQIMQSFSQRDIKALGRKVHNFNESIWLKNREKIVFDGNYAKFTQNENLKNFMLSTENKILVEASPYDTIWGIGHDDKNRAFVSNPNNWRGINLLGFTLMKVREKIISNDKN